MQQTKKTQRSAILASPSSSSMELAVQFGGSYAPNVLSKSGWGKRQRVWSPGHMADILSKQFCVIATDEFNTSQFCPCGSALSSKLTGNRPS
mmetsp:Transcript_8154/g.26056  ORF Transcript_8154/g.26056 Transcript_8154/m.26056 type:complete len:92 (+) Transcript_8154:55-330(+)